MVSTRFFSQDSSSSIDAIFVGSGSYTLCLEKHLNYFGLHELIYRKENYVTKQINKIGTKAFFFSENF